MDIIKININGKEYLVKDADAQNQILNILNRVTAIETSLEWGLYE